MVTLSVREEEYLEVSPGLNIDIFDALYYPDDMVNKELIESKSTTMTFSAPNSIMQYETTVWCLNAANRGNIDDLEKKVMNHAKKPVCPMGKPIHSFT